MAATDRITAKGGGANAPGGVASPARARRLAGARTRARASRRRRRRLLQLRALRWHRRCCQHQRCRRRLHRFQRRRRCPHGLRTGRGGSGGGTTPSGGRISDLQLRAEGRTAAATGCGWLSRGLCGGAPAGSLPQGRCFYSFSCWAGTFQRWLWQSALRGLGSASGRQSVLSGAWEGVRLWDALGDSVGAGARIGSGAREFHGPAHRRHLIRGAVA